MLNALTLYDVCLCVASLFADVNVQDAYLMDTCTQSECFDEHNMLFRLLLDIDQGFDSREAARRSAKFATTTTTTTSSVATNTKQHKWWSGAACQSSPRNSCVDRRHGSSQCVVHPQKRTSPSTLFYSSSESGNSRYLHSTHMYDCSTFTRRRC
jgi:hypothetical protein